MIISKSKVYIKKGCRKELIDHYKLLRQWPQLDFRILAPQSGRQDILIIEMTWESHAARETLFQSPPWEKAAAADWSSKRQELIDRGDDTDYFMVVE